MEKTRLPYIWIKSPFTFKEKGIDIRLAWSHTSDNESDKPIINLDINGPISL